MKFEDTIAAICTALSDSGIGIIRISGAEAVEAAEIVVKDKKGKGFVGEMPTHTLRHGFVCSAESGDVLDEVIVLRMDAPHSYTGQDVIEIQCHGGVFVMQRILKEILATKKARLAEPGEFTKRAFLCGKLDLSEAEAVADLIASRSEESEKAAVSQLSGRLSEKIRSLREEILYETAFLESAVDDPEHFSLEGYSERLQEKTKALIKETEALIKSFEGGRILKEGVRTVILGKPNTGKSSVMNLLLGSDRAIVTEIAGTTRDTLEEYVSLGKVALRLTDTAGLHDTEDPVEKMGTERAKAALEEADLVLLVIDGSRELELEDLMLFPMVFGKKCVILRNKADLTCKVPEEEFYPHFSFAVAPFGEGTSEEECKNRFPMISFSAKTGEGLPELTEFVESAFLGGMLHSAGEVVITNLRHVQALQEAKESLLLVQKAIGEGVEEDFYTIDLMNAYQSFGKIIGESVEEDLVEEIFSKFCMGK